MVEYSPDNAVIDGHIAPDMAGDAIFSATVVDIQKAEIWKDAYVVDLLGVGRLRSKGSTCEVSQ
jgi:hypothetical protein